jgi:class 3 adenylate cyclase
MVKPRGDHVLATVLFTDIVDSSRLAVELGDRRWRVLLARHHVIVRKTLKRFHGTEIDNAGDGFFASFPDQVDAIRCACAISDDVRELGIELRAGCHVGQAEVIGRKLGGVTIHTAARVMSEAAPSEVLVSSVMKDLVPASGFTFADRGLHTLKGIDGEWHLFAVTTVDGTPRGPALEPETAAHLRDEIQPPPLVQRRWARIGIPAVGVLVAATAMLVIANRPHPIQLQANSVVRIDATTNAILSDVPVASGPGPIIAVPPHELWTLSYQDQVMSVIDEDTNAEKTFAVFGGTANLTVPENAGGQGLAYAFHRVWVSGPNGEIARFSPSTKRIVEPTRKIRGLPEASPPASAAFG